MNYGTIIPGRFVARPNRFVSLVEVGQEEVVCHVKNTGRCKELLIPGVQVYLEQAQNPSRKTKFDLIAVKKGDLLINMDAQAPNKVFGEWIRQGNFVPDWTGVKAEAVYGDSRLDFCVQTPRGRHWVEVKGVTLETDGHACFPDAPTERGVRHIKHLQALVEAGEEATIAFVVQMAGMTDMAPNDETQPAFGEALRQAAKAGVHVRAWGCRVTPETLVLETEIPVLL